MQVFKGFFFSTTRQLFYEEWLALLSYISDVFHKQNCLNSSFEDQMQPFSGFWRSFGILEKDNAMENPL
jgi:hypothetical protein